MCFGGQPQQPNVVYKGPSDADIAANRASLEQYRTQMAEQQQNFQTTLQQQIDSANAETAKLQAQYERDSAAAAAAAAAQQTGAYAASASQTETPATAQTTSVVSKKQKPQGTLKIAIGGTPSSAGTGLNIGV
jgi:Tfp pilus assembly protein FimV